MEISSNYFWNIQNLEIDGLTSISSDNGTGTTKKKKKKKEKKKKKSECISEIINNLDTPKSTQQGDIPRKIGKDLFS